ncbi:MAG: DNA methyltransferase [Chloroherpetonaceae bacterium]|nr:DNA methyltransferase [Chloroherpetonaceae bacterium]
MNQLILGDCLEVLKKLPSNSIDLIYLDPPFFSNRNYEIIWGDEGEVRSFQDRWSGGIDQYIAWLKERVEEMHRLLKPTGSIFLHCDWHANAEIKIFIMNRIFKEENFRGEVIWQRTTTHNDAKKKLPVLKDTIWFYSKTSNFNYNPIYGDYNIEYLEKAYNKYDDKGRFRLDNLANPSRVNKNGLYEYKGYKPPKNGWRCTIEKMKEWDENGLIWFPVDKNGRLAFKRYLDEDKGTLVGDVWTDIPNVQFQSFERIGYPTQKPIKLLERIIQMASNEGDTVLDPFVGGGTTVVVADKLNRHWIGIDQSVAAIKVTELRLANQQDLFSKPYAIQLHKYDYDTLRYKDAFEFESWIITQFGGTPNAKKGGDKGIDGKSKDNAPIQVKRSDDIGVNVIKNFFVSAKQYDKVAFERNIHERKPVGYIIAFSFGKGAIQEAARIKNDENAIIKLVSVSEIIPIAKKPTLQVSFEDKGADKKGLREIEFRAVANSESGIEFYAWDWNFDSEKNHFKPEVLMDKEGVQTAKFKAGSHIVAVKAFDNDGLESLEVIRLKVNGVVTKE